MSITVPEHIFHAANNACNELLPKKSLQRYEKTYKSFCTWRLGEGVQGLSEDILIAYFYSKKQTLKSSTMWSLYSMLKATFIVHENVDISKYSKLIALLRRGNDNYLPKKSKVFTMENITDFLTNATDDVYLLTKVGLVFCLNGAYRIAEIHNVTLKDIEDNGTIAVVYIRQTKTKKQRFFTITNDCNGYDLYRKYRDMRPVNIKHDCFFIFYQNLRCTSQKVGINTFRAMPKRVTEFLKLPDSNLYTGHSFRRTSATLLADMGADIQVLKRHGGWRSTTVAEGYVEESIGNKVKISKQLFSSASTKISTNNDDKENYSSFASTSKTISTKNDNKDDESSFSSSSDKFIANNDINDEKSSSIRSINNDEKNEKTTFENINNLTQIEDKKVLQNLQVNKTGVVHIHI